MLNPVKKICLVSVLLTGSIAVALFSHATWGQSAAPTNAGRYQLTSVSGQPFIYMIDTQTGRCWRKSAASTGQAGQWQEDSPTWAKGK